MVNMALAATFVYNITTYSYTSTISINSGHFLSDWQGHHLLVGVSGSGTIFLDNNMRNIDIMHGLLDE